MEHCNAESMLSKYFNGELEGIEQDEYLQHVSECPDCRQQFQRSLLWADAMIFELSDVPPPPRVLKNIEQQVRRVRRFNIPRSRVMGLALIALLVGLGLGKVWSQPHVTVSRADGPVVVALQKPYPGKTDGQVMVWRASSELAITVAHLPALQSHHLYEVWTISKSGARALGPLHLNKNYGWFQGHSALTAREHLVICIEPQASANQWPGPVVLSATMPAPG